MIKPASYSKTSDQAGAAAAAKRRSAFRLRARQGTADFANVPFQVSTGSIAGDLFVMLPGGLPRTVRGG